MKWKQFWYSQLQHEYTDMTCFLNDLDQNRTYRMNLIESRNPHCGFS